MLTLLTSGLALVLVLVWLLTNVRAPGVQAASALNPAITGGEPPQAGGMPEAASVPGAAGNRLLALGNATADWTAEGEPGRYFGYSVASAGDVNGDGYADLVVGTPGFSSATARAYVYQGGASGLSATPALTLTAEGIDNRFGYSVALAGARPVRFLPRHRGRDHATV